MGCDGNEEMLAGSHEGLMIEKSTDWNEGNGMNRFFRKKRAIFYAVSVALLIKYIHLRERDDGLRGFLFVPDLAGLGTASISVKDCNL